MIFARAKARLLGFVSMYAMARALPTALPDVPEDFSPFTPKWRPADQRAASPLAKTEA